MWVLKCKGNTYYVNHLNCKVGFNTKETLLNLSTKGSLKIKGSLSITENGEATIW